MKFGFPISVLAHFGFVFGGLLLWSKGVPAYKPAEIIPLELVSVAEFSNVKAMRKPEPKPKPEELTQPEPVPVPQPENQPEPNVPPDSTEKTDAPEARPEETATPTPDAPKPPAFDPSAFEAMIKEQRENNPDANTQITLQGEANASSAGEGTGMVIDKEQYIREISGQCYPVDRGSKDYQTFRVVLSVSLDIDGKISTIDIINNAEIIASGNAAWRAHAQSLISELWGCPPYKNLPRSSYDEWKSLRLTFQPEA